jgi:hypothetical protein
MSEEFSPTLTSTLDNSSSGQYREGFTRLWGLNATQVASNPNDRYVILVVDNQEFCLLRAQDTIGLYDVPQWVEYLRAETVLPITVKLLQQILEQESEQESIPINQRVQESEEFRYDDDPEWNKSFASSQDFLRGHLIKS